MPLSVRLRGCMLCGNSQKYSMRLGPEYWLPASGKERNQGLLYIRPDNSLCNPGPDMPACPGFWLSPALWKELNF